MFGTGETVKLAKRSKSDTTAPRVNKVNRRWVIVEDGEDDVLMKLDLATVSVSKPRPFLSIGDTSHINHKFKDSGGNSVSSTVYINTPTVRSTKFFTNDNDDAEATKGKYLFFLDKPADDPADDTQQQSFCRFMIELDKKVNEIILAKRSVWFANSRFARVSESEFNSKYNPIIEERTDENTGQVNYRMQVKVEMGSNKTEEIIDNNGNLLGINGIQPGSKVRFCIKHSCILFRRDGAIYNSLVVKCAKIIATGSSMKTKRKRKLIDFE